MQGLAGNGDLPVSIAAGQPQQGHAAGIAVDIQHIGAGNGLLDRHDADDFGAAASLGSPFEDDGLRVLGDLDDLDTAVFGETEQIGRALGRLAVVAKDAVDAGITTLIDYNFEAA